ncbi:MBL fold metallo-hydrolase [Rhizobium oryzicola]|uniref:MBL fold metallo-hydrolase n=1 Tax=Rhizobium oryzicola TaxID=1232668 RepID=A0ABT8SY72_9HYPH|nr:MBL fold metallo-hydrolase [Rhizobium oryzicola]MDO1583409.1 MBL fold metallo-hydrolase [Rhizobium oryzicola]
MKIGNATLDTVVDIDPFALPIDLLFPGKTVEMLADHRSWLEPSHVEFAAGTILLGVQSHVLRVGGRIVLIDTCVGEHRPRPRRADWHQRLASGYLERLGALGIRPEDVDFVLCTHLHADHVGWNTMLADGRWVPTFPNARYLIGRAEYEHWQASEAEQPGSHNHGAFADSVAPLVEADRVDLVEDGFSLFEGVTLQPLPGHSPGQLGLCLCHRSEKVLFCADAVHSPVQVPHPNWASRFCADPQQAIATRIAVFEDSAANGTVLVPAHLRHSSGLRVLRAGAVFTPEFLP